MKEKVYAVVVLLCCLMFAGTEGALLLGNISMKQGCIQIGVSMVAGLFFFYLIYLEETRAARRLR